MKIKRWFFLIALFVIGAMVSDIVADSLDPCQWSQSQTCASPACHVGGCQAHFGNILVSTFVEPDIKEIFTVADLFFHIPEAPVRLLFHPPAVYN